MPTVDVGGLAGRVAVARPAAHHCAVSVSVSIFGFDFDRLERAGGRRVSRGRAAALAGGAVGGLWAVGVVEMLRRVG